MASAPLVEQQINYGSKLLDALKQSDFNVNAALWWYSPEAERWMLMIATKEVETAGPNKAYQKLHEVLTNARDNGIYIGMPSISLVDPKHPLLSTLRDYFRFRQDQPAKGAQISQQMINGYAIDGAYVYYL